MNQQLENRIRYWLKEASDMGFRGFVYDYNLSDKEQEDYLEFEEEAIQDIDNFYQILNSVNKLKES